MYILIYSTSKGYLFERSIQLRGRGCGTNYQGWYTGNVFSAPPRVQFEVFGWNPRGSLPWSRSTRVDFAGASSRQALLAHSYSKLHVWRSRLQLEHRTVDRRTSVRVYLLPFTKLGISPALSVSFMSDARSRWTLPPGIHASKRETENTCSGQSAPRRAGYLYF